MAFNPKDFLKNKPKSAKPAKLGFDDSNPSDSDNSSPKKTSPSSDQSPSDKPTQSKPQPKPSKPDNPPSDKPESGSTKPTDTPPEESSSSNSPTTATQKKETGSSSDLPEHHPKPSPDPTQPNKSIDPNPDESEDNSRPKQPTDTKNLPNVSIYKFYGTPIRFILHQDNIYFVLRDVLPLGDMAPNQESLIKLQTNSQLQESWDQLTQEITFIDQEDNPQTELFTTPNDFLAISKNLPNEIKGPIFSWFDKISGFIQEG